MPDPSFTPREEARLPCATSTTAGARPGEAGDAVRDREFKTRANGGAQPFSVRPVAIVEPGFHALVDEGRVRPDLYGASPSSRFRFPRCESAARTSPRCAAVCLEGVPGPHVEEKVIDVASQTVLAALPWHGNVREMRTLLEGLVQATPETTISLRTLLEHVTLDAPEAVHAPSACPCAKRGSVFEREYVAAVVAQHHGRIPDAAKSLGIQRTNLYRKLRRCAWRTPRSTPNAAGRDSLPHRSGVFPSPALAVRRRWLVLLAAGPARGQAPEVDGWDTGRWRFGHWPSLPRRAEETSAGTATSSTRPRTPSRALRPPWARR